MNLANGGDQFRRSLGLDEKRTLLDVSWSSARMAWQGMERTAITEEEEAKALAQRIGQKLEGLLSRNPKVTARALELYDADLPKGLMEVWENPFDTAAAEQFGSAEDLWPLRAWGTSRSEGTGRYRGRRGVQIA